MKKRAAGRLARLARIARWQGRERRSPSIVLLLREARVFTLSDLRNAAQSGWGRVFDGASDRDYVVEEEGGRTLLRAGGCLVEIAVGFGPYVNHAERAAAKLPDELQRRAWREHGAWVALDLRCRGMKKGEAYAGLARFALQIGDQNCVAIYLPGERVFLPNDGSAEEALRLMVRGAFLPKRFRRLRRWAGKPDRGEGI